MLEANAYSTHDCVSSVVISNATESWTAVRSPLQRSFVLRTGSFLLVILLHFFRRSTGTDMETHSPVKLLLSPNFWATRSLNRPIHAFNSVFIKLSNSGSLQLWQVLTTCLTFDIVEWYKLEFWWTNFIEVNGWFQVCTSCDKLMSWLKAPPKNVSSSLAASLWAVSQVLNNDRCNAYKQWATKSVTTYV